MKAPKTEEKPPFAPLFEINAPYTELTFALIKTHAVCRIGSIVDRILAEKITIVGARPAELSGDQILWLYRAHARKPYWSSLVKSVSGPTVAMALAGRNVVEHWRLLLGATDPAKAEDGSLRGLYGSRKVMAENVAHGSDSLQAAERELRLFFPAQFKLYGTP